MRLTKFEQEAIKNNALEIFGNKTEVFLFGSRVDDNKRGGDIDLYIKAPNKEDDLFDKKMNYISSLYDDIGEQKIDVVIARDESRSIEQEAIKNGIKL